MNIIQINTKFPTEFDAIQYFERYRWRKGKECPYCESEKLSKRQKDHRFHCMECKKSFSVTTNTHLHNTRLPLQTWLFAFSIVTDAKKGLSALQLQRNLSVSYPTAWAMYHKIREIMILENNEIEELDDIVEMDETYVGGKPRPGGKGESCLPEKKKKEYDEKIDELEERGFEIKEGTRKVVCDINTKRGRGTKKIPVVGIVQRDGNVVAQVMRKLTYDNLKEMVQKHVDEDDSVLITDEYRSYSRFNKIIEHVKVDHQKMYSYRGLNTNTIESFWAIIKRQIIGQHHHVSPKHLPKYVAETVFKFNNRKDDDMFVTLIRNSVKNPLYQ
jgi:transposase-like protein